MSTVNQHITIPKNITTNNDLDFHFLRKEGISYLQEFAGTLWTDFNSHDPGVTILEMLCYAITDLGMRIDAPIENLLASKESSKSILSQFYRASDIFPSKPVNESDYRKLFIDIDGVKNCWLKKYEKTVYVNCNNNALSYTSHDDVLPEFQKEFQLKGLYSLSVDLEEGYEEDVVFEAIKKVYHENRNLCEDLVEIKQVATKSIAICASIEVLPEADEEWVYANIKYQIENYLSPSLQFYGVQKMLDKGYTTDEIFEGPVLENGFIDPEELKNTALRSEVRLSDIMKIIMNIEGVKLIEDISVGFCDEDITQENKWVVCIGADTKPELCDKSVFNFNKGALPLNLNFTRANAYFEEIKEEAIESQIVEASEKKLAVPQGVPFDSHEYMTIQNGFPDTYGIGQEGLTVHVTGERRAQAKQLKAYLTFFDQILATYFKHLSQVSTLLSVNGEDARSYFTQAIKEVKDFEELVDDYPHANDHQLTELLLEKFDNNIERRNSILDHLLARFAERFGEYTFIMKALFGTATDEIVLYNKESFLKDYKVISSTRGSAFNYKAADVWDTDNVSGFQKRASRLMGIANSNRRYLSRATNVVIYNLNEPDEEEKYRWRIKDNDDNILLSATEYYTTVSLAEEELYFAVLQLVQTSINEIEDISEDGDWDEVYAGFIRIDKTKPEDEETPVRYSFEVLNPDENGKDYIIAKQYTYHDTIAQVKEAAINLITFLKQEFTEEGMFLVEHMLLRPDVTNGESGTHFFPICADDCNDCGSLDPYSYKVSIILPGFTYRFFNPDFRHYMEDIIRQELPAHIVPKICWVGNRRTVTEDSENDLFQFENAYKSYLNEKKNLQQEQPITGDNELQLLLDAMQELNNIYSAGRLTDCSTDDEALDGRIILGRSNI